MHCLLLHGLGATGAVWWSVARCLEAQGHTVHAPDLPGHGAAKSLTEYTVPAMAAAIARNLPGPPPDLVVGHSLGGYIALALAGGRDGVAPAQTAVFSTKLQFSSDEQQQLRALAARPARQFTTEAEAVARYRRVAGLLTALAPEPDWVERGVQGQGEDWTLTTDPRAYAIEAPPFAALLAEARGTVRAAVGSADPMVTIAALRACIPGAIDWTGLGHNPHVEAPERVSDWLLATS